MRTSKRISVNVQRANDKSPHPLVRRGKIFDVYDWTKYVLIHGDRFLPTWDSTDHFQFACAKCLTIASIGMVDLRHEGSDLCLYFYLECTNCHSSGQRKIYLQPEDDRMAFCHRTLADNNSIYRYFKGRKPDKWVLNEEE